MFRQHPARVAALVTLAVVLAACGSGSTASSEATSTATESTTASASMEASTSASAGESGSGIDLGDAAQEVSDLSAYQLDITVNGAEAEQAMTIIATTDPKATHYTIAGQLELISIEGEGAWLKQGDTWTEAPGGEDAYATLFDAMAPDTLIGGYALDSYGDYFTDQGVEDRNGVQARHLHADASSVPAEVEGDFPEDGNIDVWVAEDGGYLVAMHFSGTDPDSGELSEVRIEVSHVNDGSLSIEAPI